MKLAGSARGAHGRRSFLVAKLIAITEVAVVLTKYEFWTLPLYMDYSSEYILESVIGSGLWIAFITMPVLAVVGVVGHRAYGYWFMGAFPVVAGLGLGITAVPFVGLVYPLVPAPSAWILLVINAAVVVASIVLGRRARLGVREIGGGDR